MYKISYRGSSEEPVSDSHQKALGLITKEFLKSTVERISVPRHYLAEKETNWEISEWIFQQFQSYGYKPFRQGAYDNIIATSWRPTRKNRPCILIGAHYDSVPRTPGADDNGSAVAAMLACAKALTESIEKPEHTPDVCFVAFNREEDGLLGSIDFVDHFVLKQRVLVGFAHILEMVGYTDKTEGSQTYPISIPGMPKVGDFIGLVSNKTSNSFVQEIVECGKQYTPTLPIEALQLYLGAERVFTDFQRSDHAPFWHANIPAVMWTDTSNFRNPNYHKDTDTPDTLDYDFLLNVTRLLFVHVLKWKSDPQLPRI